jgi:hypothetical protein
VRLDRVSPCFDVSLSRCDSGVSLLDALIATTLVVSTMTGVAHLVIWSRRAVWVAGLASTSTALAGQKLEQLRGLAWHVDGDGRDVSDLTTDLSTEPPSAAGTGLQASPPGTLEGNTPGFVDFTDMQGRWLGTGRAPPPGAAFLRRWAIVPLDSDPLDSVILHVAVLPVSEAVVRGGTRGGGAAYVTTIRTRSLP